MAEADLEDGVDVDLIGVGEAEEGSIRQTFLQAEDSTFHRRMLYHQQNSY